MSSAIGRSWRLAAVPVVVAWLAGHVLAAQAPAPTQSSSGQPQAPPKFEETVEVVGATPTHGLGIDRNKIPSNIQTATAERAWRRCLRADKDRLLPSGSCGERVRRVKTTTKTTLLSLRGRHSAGPNVALDGMVFYRRAVIGTFNGDDSDYDECVDEDFETDERGTVGHASGRLKEV